MPVQHFRVIDDGTRAHYGCLGSRSEDIRIAWRQIDARRLKRVRMGQPPDLEDEQRLQALRLEAIERLKSKSRLNPALSS